MDQSDSSITSSRARRVVAALLFCAICVTINFIGMEIASVFHLPLYLDNVGILLAAMVGGYLPGVVVGYLTNIVNSFIEPSSFYYSVISVMIAVVAAGFAQRGWFKSVPKTLLAIAVFALLGGGVASLLTWNLFGFSAANGTTSSFVMALHDSTDLSPFLAQLSGDILIDLLDKTIVTVIALGIYHLLPANLMELLRFELWQQKPLSPREVAVVKGSKQRLISVRAKVAAVISVIMFAVAIVTTNISYFTFNASMVDEQAAKAEGIVNLAKLVVDPERVDDYLARGEEVPGYLETEAELADIRESFAGVEYVYVYRILEDGCHVVFDPDTEDLPGSDPGSIVEFDEAFMPYLDDLLAGRPIEPLVSDETYGWLLTVYQPLYDADGQCVCYVAVDINMDHIIAESYQFLTRVIALFGAFFILVCVIVMWLADYSLVIPIDSIAHVMGFFAFDSAADRVETLKQVRSLEIHTGDEVENLYDALVKTAEDTVESIAESQEKTATISRMQDNLIMVMADLVESRDQYTGDHVRKTAAYALICMEQMMIDGIYVDQLTPDFVSDVYHSAPLHDIGKIAVTDAVLNKPGRLTDDEFEMMKQHTTAGREILERAVGAVSEETYLDEARNLAEYHHEKWNGQGYPRGLAGEEIPLSARIMAVADVFDALVSKRSYKDGFPLDKAFAIIEEGKGTHFDPLIAQAFLDAREEVERVVRFYGDGQTDKEPKAEEGTGEGRPSEEPKAGE